MDQNIQGHRPACPYHQCVFADIYNSHEILRAGIIPIELIANNPAFLPQMMDFSPHDDVYSRIVGTDIIRTCEDDFFVLKDNVRRPSGVRYMLETVKRCCKCFQSCSARSRYSLPVIIRKPVPFAGYLCA